MNIILALFDRYPHVPGVDTSIGRSKCLQEIKMAILCREMKEVSLVGVIFLPQTVVTGQLLQDLTASTAHRYSTLSLLTSQGSSYTTLHKVLMWLLFNLFLQQDLDIHVISPDKYRRSIVVIMSWSSILYVPIYNRPTPTPPPLRLLTSEAYISHYTEC